MMNNLFKLGAFAALVLAIPAAPALAQQPLQLSGDVMVEKTVVDDAGNSSTELVKPDVVVPGDRLIFGTEYHNTGAEPVEKFVVTNPLPSAVRLADDADPALVVSVDGGKSWGTLAELTVASDDMVTRAASAADVTHVRWTLAVVQPGEKGRLEYPAIIR
ncbi:hypothetical protein [Parerythrobacter aestuarii]|uniref:hypothetical protein n=1 Tax=Parerythrobacter aestuarii TaxID=3020909 RepID=UPI0024DE7191|nr:hypothetical protein [Parerythrobacter aestuarii]